MGMILIGYGMVWCGMMMTMMMMMMMMMIMMVMIILRRQDRWLVGFPPRKSTSRSDDRPANTAPNARAPSSVMLFPEDVH